jgi:hypothetical protein
MLLIPYQTLDVPDTVPRVKTLLQAGARLYMHLAREVIATFGREGEITVRQHLRDYGLWRGTEMR